MSRPARPLLALLAASFLVACGGQLAPVVTDLPFAPEQRTSGYGYTGGMHVTLVDPHTDGVQRTLRVDASQLSGTFDVANGAAKVTLTETGAPGGTKAFGGVSGVVVIDPIATGAGAGAPTVTVHVDLLLSDPASPSHELHLSGDFETELAYVG